MPVAPKVQVLYRRNGDISLGWSPLEKSEAKSFNLYGSSTPSGIYSLVRSNIQNKVDRNLKNKVSALVKDSEIPIPPNTRFYFKLTYIDLADIESNIALSPIATVYPFSVDLHFENEQQEANNHNFGWVEQNQRWEKLLLTPDGKLMVDATVDIGSISIGNVKIAARTDGTTLEYVLVDDNRRIVVNQDPSAINRIRDYEEVTTVLPDTETVLLSYTNAEVYYLEKVMCSGSADAVFKLKLNGVVIATLRNSWNDRNIVFDFSDKSIYCSANTTVTVTVKHSEINSQDYEASLLGYTHNI